MSSGAKVQETMDIVRLRPCKTYKLSHLINTHRPHDESSWEDRGHVITIISPSPSTYFSMMDELFINCEHINPINWRWIHKGREIAWHQGEGDGLRGGHLGFSDDGMEGYGVMHHGEKERESVRAEHMWSDSEKDYVTPSDFVVGTYDLFDPSGTKKPPMKISVCAKRLVCDGKPLLNTNVVDSKLEWKDLNSTSPDMVLPSTGSVEFSPDGTRVINSSFGAVGHRVFGSTARNPSLSLTRLLTMNPFEREGNKNMEVVQRNAMQGFYKILQTNMPKDDRVSFISALPPDLGDIRGIAENSTANSEWYASLSTPYLVTALKPAPRNSVRKLNARRAETKLKKATSTSSVYQNQASSLYTHEWIKKYSIMQDFLTDQKRNTAQQHSSIDKETEAWVERLRSGMSNVDQEEKNELQQMITIAQNASSRAKSGTYWAFILFRYLCSDGFLNSQRLLMTSGNTSEEATQDIQRYSSILSILDPSSYFMQEFVQVIQIQQLSSLLPSFLDYSGNIIENTFLMQLIAEKFLKDYADSQDPVIKQRVEDVSEQLRLNNIQRYLEFFALTSTVGSQSWDSLTKNFTNSCVRAFGKVARVTAEFLVSIAAVTGMLQLVFGLEKWSDFSDAERGGFIVGTFKLVALFIRKGVTAAVAYQATGSVWEGFKVFLYRDVRKVYDNVTNSFGKWIAGNGETVSDLAILFGEAEPTIADQYPRFCRAFGRNLNEFMASRFAAAMAIVGIIISCIGIANASSPVGIALNTMFLLSAILDLVAAVAQWAISFGYESIVGALSIATISTVAGALAIVGAVIGVILIIVEFSITHKPPNPVDQFVESDAVKTGGYYMELEAAVDYFQTVNDDKGEPEYVGISVQYETNQKYLKVNNDQTLVLGTLSHALDTVLTVSTDYQGHSHLLTQIWENAQPGSEVKFNSKVVGLTLGQDGTTVSMQGPISDQDQMDRQRWKITCVQGGEYQSDKRAFLKTATFTIESVKAKGKYITVSNSAITIGSTETRFILTIQKMKPGFLSFPDILIYLEQLGGQFFPFLGQVGTISGRQWNISPDLPNFMELNKSTGIISQKEGLAPSLFPQTSFTITVNNSEGSVSASFTIEVQNAPPNSPPTM